MMKNFSLMNKVEDFIKNTTSWNELEVMYLFVQTRKLLDYHRHNSDGKSDYPHLRFYCDWLVHITKDRIEASTLEVLKGVEKGFIEMLGNPNYHSNKPIDYVYFTSLHSELLNFFDEQEIDCLLLKEDKIWISVISSLVKNLENQPLNIDKVHGLAIKNIVFIPCVDRAVVLVAYFNEPIRGKDGIDYGFLS